MSPDLFFENKKYISTKAAATLSGYSNDYIGQLCRGKKIDSKRIGRVWYVSEESILSHKKNFALEPSRPAETPSSEVVKRISDDRERAETSIKGSLSSAKRDYRWQGFFLNSAPSKGLVFTTIALAFVFSLVSSSGFNLSKISNKISSLPIDTYSVLDELTTFYSDALGQGYDRAGLAIVDAASYLKEKSTNVLMNPSLYIVEGVRLISTRETKFFDASAAGSVRLAQDTHQKVFSFISDSVGEVADLTGSIKQTKNLAANAVSSLNPFDNTGIKIYRGVNSWFEKFVYSPMSKFFATPQTVAPAALVVNKNAGINISPVKVVNTTNVIERTIERATLPEVTMLQVDTKMQELNNKLMSEFSRLSTGNGGSVTNIYQEIAQSQRIDNLSGTTISNPSITGGSLSGVSISATSLAVTGSATSTFANGIDLTSGCFSVDGVCIEGGVGSTDIAAVNSYINASTTIPKLYTANLFNGANTFNGAVTLGTLNGPLQANAGVVSATSSVGVLYGGTGLSLAPGYGQVLLGNSAGGYDLVATSSLGIIGGGGGGGIQSLNGLSFLNQTFSTSTSAGLNLTITSAGSDHLFTLSPSSGYIIPLSASTTEWSDFYTTPSNRITAGMNLAWNGNILNLSTTTLNLTTGAFTSNNISQWNNDSQYITGINQLGRIGDVSTSSLAYGHVLLWDGSKWQDTATSSLGITSAVWGNITGTLSNQTDLQSALNGKIEQGTTSVSSITALPNLSITKSQVSDFGGPYLTAAITSLNGQTQVTQTFATTSINGNFGFTSSGGVHTLNIPTASSLSLGLLSSSDWNIFNNKVSSTTAVNTTYPILGGGDLSASRTLSLDFGTTTVNTWSALQTLNGGLTVAGNTTLGSVAINSLLSTDASGIITATSTPTFGNFNATSTNATSTIAGGVEIVKGLNLGSGYIFGAGLTTCDPSSGKLVWDSTTGKFSCGSDAGAGGGLTSLNGLNPSVQTFATSTATGIGLSIVSSGSTHTFTPTVSTGYIIPLSASTTEWNNFYTTPSNRITAGMNLAWNGNILNLSTTTLNLTTSAFASNNISQWNNDSQYITGINQLGMIGDVSTSSLAYGHVLLWDGSKWQDSATSSLGLLTTNVAEGSNKYYTDQRVIDLIHASTTIPKTYTANTFTALQTLNGGLTISGNTTLSSVAINSLLSTNASGVITATSTPTFGNFNATSTTATSTIAGGLAVGTNKFVVDYSSGNIGIGTAAPGVKLQVVGQSGTGNTGVMNITGYDQFGQSLVMQLPNAGYTGALSAIMKAYGGNGQAMGFLTHFTSDVVDRFSIANHSGAENFTVMDSGNVGVGTTSPYRSLSVVGSGVFTGGDVLASTFTATSSVSTPALTLGTLNGPLQANAGVVSATTSIGVLYGGTGATDAATARTNLGVINYTDAAVNSYIHASTTIPKTYTSNAFTNTNSFSGLLTYTATALNSLLSTDGSGNIVATSTPTFGNFNATSTTATSTIAGGLEITKGITLGGYVYGAGLGSCDPTSGKLIWNSVTGQFGCGADAGAGGGITAIGAQYSAFQNGSSQTLATSTSGNLTLSILSSGNTHTFTPGVASGYIIPLSASTTEWNNFYTTPSNRITAGMNLAWNGNILNLSTTTLNLTTSAFASNNISQWNNDSQYITGINQLGMIGDVSTSSLAYGHVLLWDGSKWQDSATSSLGLLTTNVAEGSNKYYTDQRVIDLIHASTTIPKTYTANTFTALQTFGNSSTTLASFTYASSTNAYFGALSLGGTDLQTTLNGKQATISTTWPITLSGATLGFNGLSTSTSAVVGNIPYFSGVNTFANVATSTLAVGTSLSSSGTLGYQIGGTNSTLSLNMNNGNSWTANQTFALSSTTYGSFITASTTNLTIGGSTFTSLLGAGLNNTGGALTIDSTTLNNNINSYISASSTIPKTYSDNTFTGTNTFNSTFTLGTLNGPLQANAGVVSATTSVGILYGGTGLTSVTAAGVLLGNYAGTGYQQLATSSLGLLTTNVAEGSNKYYTDQRVIDLIHASTTIPKTYTANTFTALQTLNGGLTISGNTTLSSVAINSLLSTDSSGIITATSTPTFGNFNATSTTATSTIAGGLAVGTSKFVVDYSTGNVGIDTASPAYKLDVNGTGNFASTLTASAIKLTSGATDGYFLRSDASGNGTWTPVAASQVFKGTWDAGSNTPTLADGVGTAGWYYRVVVGGTIDLGSGNITFTAGDDVSYNGTIWQRIPSSGYTLVTATNSTLGGIKVGGSLQINSGVLDINNADMGDITVSGTGADVGKIWTIDSGAVSYSKIQNISAQYRVLGRTSSGAGSIEELSMTGTGSVAMSNSPIFVSPTLGNAAATSLTLGTLNGPLQANAGVVSATTSVGILYGGTGLTSVTAAGVLLGNYAGTGYQQLATSSLGLLTTNVAEGSNKYYTDQRVIDLIHASTTIPKTYTTNTFTALQTFGNSSTTLASFTYASSTNAYFGALSLGGTDLQTTLNGKQATISTTWPITLSGATLGFNGLSTTTSAVVGNIPYFSGVNTFANVATSTLAVGTSLSSSGTLGYQIGGTNSTLSLNMNNGNSWTANQTFALSSTTYGSFITASTTNLTIGGSTFTSLLGVGLNNTGGALTIDSTTLNNNINSYISASSTIPKTYSDNTFTGTNTFNSTFTLGTLNGPLQANAGVVSATTSVGILYGGTGLTSVTAAGVLLGNYAGTGYQQLATSSLGLLTTNVAEGSNKYYTDQRVIDLIHASTTIPKTYTTNTFTALQTFGNSSTTLASFTYASSTNAYFGALSLGGTDLQTTLNGKQATISTTWPITLSGATLGFNGLSTSTSAVVGNIPYFSGVNTFANVATSSLAVGTSLSSSGTLGYQIGGTDSTLSLNMNNGNSWTANQTFALSSTTYGSFITASTTNLTIGGSTFTSLLGVGLNNTGGALTIDSTALSNSINTYVAASTTIPKTYTANTFSALQTLNGGLTISGNTTLGSVAINSLLSTDASGIITATSTPTFGNFNATSTTATSTIAGGLAIGANKFVVDYSTGNVGVGTTPSSNIKISSLSSSTISTSNPNVNNLSLSTSFDSDGSVTGSAVSLFSDSVIPSNNTNNISSNEAGFFNAANFGSGNLSSLHGIYTQAYSKAQGNISELAALSAMVNVSGSGVASPGTVTNAYGVTVASGVVSGANVTNLYNLNVNSVVSAGAGHLTNNYGLYIGSQSAGSALNQAIYTNQSSSANGSYAIYNAGDAPSYFAGNLGLGTTTPQYILSSYSSTAPQLSLSAGAGLAQWTFRNAGGNFYLGTTTVAGTATTSISALEIAGGGFGTTTVRGLNISGQATSTSNVGWNITSGCYAIGGNCLSLSTLGGVLPTSQGGTGQNLGASSGILNFYSGVASTIATSSLGLLTTNVAEGTNLYYTAQRVIDLIHASTTIPKTYTANTFTALQTFGNSSTTLASFTYASSTNAYFGALSLGGTDLQTTLNGKQATISTTWPITLSGATVGFNGLSTSTAAVVGNIPYFSGANTFANVATSSLAVGTSLSSSGTLGYQIGGTDSTLSLNMNNGNSWTANQTFALSSTTYGSFITASTTNLTIGGSTFTSLLGAGLNNTGGALTIDSTALSNSINTYVAASTTIPKTYTNNTFTGTNAFNSTFTLGTLNGPLQANNGVVTATTSVGILYGGTGATDAATARTNLGVINYTDAAVNSYIHASTTIPKLYTANTFTALQTLSGGLTISGNTTLSSVAINSLLSTDSSGIITATSTPTFGSFNATSTTATSTIAGGLAIGTNKFVVDYSTGNVGIGTASPSSILTVSKDSIGSTPTDGLLLQNLTAATVGAQQYSPRLHFTGNGWATTPVSSQALDWTVEGVPVQGAANPTYQLTFSNQINGGGYTKRAIIDGSVVYTAVFAASSDLSNPGGSRLAIINSTGVAVASGGALGWGANSGDAGGAMDAQFRRFAAGNIQLGAVAASPAVAQTLSVQDASGTDIAGANWTFRASRATGSGLNGGYIWQTGDQGTTGTTLATASTKMTLLANGNLGLGTTTPQYILSSFSSSAPQLALSAGAGLAQWTFRNAGGNFYLSTTTTDGTATTTTSALTILNNGNVGIGNSSPAATLDVSGNINLSVAYPKISTAENNLTIQTSTNKPRATFGSDYINFYDTNSGGATSVMIGGKFGIATGTPQYVLSSYSASAPQLALSAGAGLAQWTFRNAGGNFYLSTTTTDGTATTSISALEIATGGFGTTTVRGLNIAGSATSTSNVGWNITSGCYAVSGVCLTSYSDSLVNAYIHASTTIPKLYTDNTFTGSNTFDGTFTLGTLNGPLQANAGVVSATTSIGVLYGGTGATDAATARTNLGVINYTDAAVNSYIHASTTIPKLYTANTFTALQTLNGGLTVGGSTILEKDSSEYVASPILKLIDADRTVTATITATNPGDITNGLYLGTDSSHPLMLGTAGAEKLRITTTGSVGIGTTTPWGKFAINNLATDITQPLFTIASSTASATTTLLTVLNSGNVGIGTTNPLGNLHVYSPSGDSFVISDATSANTSQFRLYKDGLLKWSMYSPVASNDLKFYDTADRVTFQYGGNVGIGTTSPVSKLHVEGLTTASGANAIAGIFASTTLANSTGSGFQFGNRFLNTVSGGTAGTEDGMFIRMTDNTSLANTVRGLEVQAYSGSNTSGINEGIVAYGKTFGVHAYTNGLAGAVSTPAAVFAELDHPTSGNAIRAYSATSTTATLLSIYQETSAYTGTALLMNLGNGAGSFNGGNFIDLKKANTSVFSVNNLGNLAVTLPASTNNFAVCHETNGAGLDTLKDCSGAPGADYQEIYPTDSDVVWGDVLAAGSSTIITSNGDNLSVLTKVNNAYSTNIIGVAANPLDSGDFNTIGYNLSTTTHSNPIALKGRVKVKVSTENGDIKIGDFLTSSATQPGYAMKATRSGQVIGQALEGFSSTVGSGSTTSSVLTFINIGWQNIGNQFVLGENSGQLSGNVAGQTLASTADASFLINQKGSGNIIQLQSNGVNRFMVATSGAMTVLSQSANVRDAIMTVKNNSDEVFSINARGDVAMSGVIIVKDDNFAGSIATNEKGTADINFTYDLGTGKPVVELTPESDSPVFAQVLSWKKDSSENYIGFTIKTFGINGTPTSAVVHYLVTGKRDGYNTNGQTVTISNAPVAPVTITPAVDTTGATTTEIINTGTGTTTTPTIVTDNATTTTDTTVVTGGTTTSPDVTPVADTSNTATVINSVVTPPTTDTTVAPVIDMTTTPVTDTTTMPADTVVTTVDTTTVTQ